MYKWSINRVTNPDPVYSHSYTWQLVSEVGYWQWLKINNKFMFVTWKTSNISHFHIHQQFIKPLSNSNQRTHSGTHTHTHTLIPWSWVILENPPVAQLLKRFPIFYDTRKFITVFTRALTHIYTHYINGVTILKCKWILWLKQLYQLLGIYNRSNQIQNRRELAFHFVDWNATIQHRDMCYIGLLNEYFLR
jgi:hypothetical protein